MPPEEAPAYITHLTPLEKSILADFRGLDEKGKKAAFPYAEERASGRSISPDTLRGGIEQGVYPFGLCIKTDGSAVYQIFKRLLDEWIAERAVEEVP